MFITRGQFVCPKFDRYFLLCYFLNSPLKNMRFSKWENSFFSLTLVNIWILKMFPLFVKKLPKRVTSKWDFLHWGLCFIFEHVQISTPRTKNDAGFLIYIWSNSAKYKEDAINSTVVVLMDEVDYFVPTSYKTL